MKLLEPCGFEGSLRTLQRYLSGLRKAQGLPPVRIKVAQTWPKVVAPQSPPFTPRQAAYLVVLNPENRQAEETDLPKADDAAASGLDVAGGVGR